MTRRAILISECENLFGLLSQFIEVIHPGDWARARSLQTVGFHAHASDVEIPFELVDLIDHIEMFIAALFVEDPFAKHEHTHVVAFVHSDIRKPHCVVNGLPIVGGDYKENLHRDTLPSKRSDQPPECDSL